MGKVGAKETKPIPKKLVESLSDEDIKKKEYERILALISDRVDEIWHFICQYSHRKLNWWAFRNDVELGFGNGSTGGEFDPEEDAEFIEIIGDNGRIYKSEYYPFNDGFPTEYLWAENYQALVKKEVDEAKKKDAESQKNKKEKLAVRKAKKSELIAAVKAKLTPEELKVVKFK